jgi:RNA polymerase sigma-70 factor (ECF subfamily)
MRGDALAADDLVQDCLERALSRLDRWKRGSDLRAWLFTIMHNVYVNQVRRSVNGPQFVELPEQEPPGSSANAETAVNLDNLQRSLDWLAPDLREVLLLVTVEGLRYKEVADILGIPQGTVMSRLSRARQQLRSILAQGQSPSIRRVK